MDAAGKSTRNKSQAIYLTKPADDGLTEDLLDALAFAIHCEKEAESLLAHNEAEQALRDMLALAETTKKERSKFENELNEAHVDFEKNIETKAYKKKLNIFFLFLFVPSLLAAASIGRLGVAATIVVLLSYFIFRSRAPNSLDTDDIEESINKAQSGFDEAQKALHSTIESIEELKQILSHDGAHPELAAIGRVYYPMMSEEVGGRRVLIDVVGDLSSDATFRLPEFGDNAKHVALVKQAVDATQNPPMLLAPSARASSGAATLYGEEAKLLNAVQMFTELVNSVPFDQVSLPLISKDARVWQFLTRIKPLESRDELQGYVLTPPREQYPSEAVRTLHTMLSGVGELGSGAAELLGSVHQSLEGRLQTYRHLRNDALDAMHDRLTEAMSKSRLLSVHCYDPNQAAVPDYLHHRIGVHPDEAHTLPIEDLLTLLNKDPSANQRMASQPQLVSGLREAFHGLAAIAQQINAASGGTESSFISPKATALESQAKELMDTFKALYHEIVTGSPEGHVDLGNASRLFYDPERDLWHSPVDDSVFTEHEASMGRILRAKSDLMLPMWNALWVEQDQFRKSEIFRTNEALQRMAEKESEKVLAIAESYKADLRPVRENLIQQITTVETKFSQLTDTIDSLEMLGQLTPDRARELKKTMETSERGDITAAKRRAEDQERILSSEPSNQLTRRRTAADPIEMDRSPDILFKMSQPQNSSRLRFAAPDAELPTDEPTRPGLLGHDQGATDV